MYYRHLCKSATFCDFQELGNRLVSKRWLAPCQTVCAGLRGLHAMCWLVDRETEHTHTQFIVCVNIYIYISYIYTYLNDISTYMYMHICIYIHIFIYI